jgi:ribosome maturation factor RimP
MNLLDENIKEIVSKVVERNGFFLIDLILRGTEHKRVIEVFIDGEKDISAEDCATVSREIDSELKDLLIKHPDYRLDVSSPGIDRPLKFLNQYIKHANRKFDISYRSGEEIKKLSGKLVSIDGDYLTFISNNKEVIINFNNIVKANVIVSFS